MGFASISSLLITLVTLTSANQTADDAFFFRISLHVFSGRLPPVWDIDNSNRNFYHILDGLTGHNSTPLASRLGYCGFTIDEFHNGVLRKSLDVGRCTRPDFEMMLLDTVEDIPPKSYNEPLADDVIQYVRGPILACDS